VGVGVYVGVGVELKLMGGLGLTCEGASGLPPAGLI
jgi:hypothetical protein